MRINALLSPMNTMKALGWGGGGNSAYKRSGDARRKFLIKPLKKTDLGVAQAFLFLTPKRDHVKIQTNEKTWII